jgi:hypothetical protein
MKIIFSVGMLLMLSINTFAERRDTVRVQPVNLDLKKLQTGDMNYIMYTKKSKTDIPVRITLVSFNIERSNYEGNQAVTVKQQWNTDTTTHKCLTIFDASTFGTFYHETYWKRLGYKMKFDFRNKVVTFDPANTAVTIPDSVKVNTNADFLASLNAYNLNWHADMIIYSLLKYQTGRTFLINYYDPGFGKAELVGYTVTGNELLTGSGGQKVDCWVLNHFNDGQSDGQGYERFWISKAKNEVLKMEDFGGKGHGYRYKIKLGVSLE